VIEGAAAALGALLVAGLNEIRATIRARRADRDRAELLADAAREAMTTSSSWSRESAETHGPTGHGP
jgi:hypothetical protein